MADTFFVQSQFDDLIEVHGRLVTWQAAFRCSCWKVASGSPNSSCKACGGVGFVYQPAVTAKAVIQGLNIKKDFIPVGEWRAGDMTCSVPNKLAQYTPSPTGNLLSWVDNPMWSIGEWDLVAVPNSEQRASEVLSRGTPLWRRPANTLLYPAASIVNVMSLFTSNPVSGVITSFTAGVSGTDFTVAGGAVTWVGGSTADYTVVGNVVNFNPSGANAVNLATGEPYSVTYTHLTTYIVYMQLPTSRDQDGQHMPRKVILRLKDVGTK